jgi:NAD(P)-dependent dehydrogenase (short-subunit alcohol dehydrogenase family)
MASLTGKVAVITGAGKGIGKACARLFAAEGAAVVLAARTEGDIEAVAAGIVAAGGRALAVPTDVANEASVEGLFARAAAEFGQVDILVNNAGVYHGWAPIADYKTEDWDSLLQVNLRGVFLCTRAALRLMKERRRGKVINISSVAGKWAMGNGAAYCTSKFGLDGFSWVGAREGREFGVSFTTINPGVVNTDGQGEDNPAKAGWLHPEEVAQAALFAASARPETTVFEITLFPIEQAPW